MDVFYHRPLEPFLRVQQLKPPFAIPFRTFSSPTSRSRISQNESSCPHRFRRLLQRSPCALRPSNNHCKKRQCLLESSLLLTYAAVL